MSSSPQSPGSAASKPAAPEPAAPEPASRPKWGRALWTAALVCLALLGPASSAWAGPSGDLGGMELTAPVRHQLWRLQQAWQEWSKHFIAGDREKADNEIQQLLSITEHLGMARLPDLSTAAAAFSVKYAREGDFERAYWARTAAEELDFGRPETAFARSTVQRLEGDFFGAVISGMRGYIAVLQMPLERKLWLNNIGLWLLFTLLMSGVVFVCLLMLTQGRKLFYDLSRLYSPPLQPLAANLVTLLLLLWPLFLPSGWVWLVIFWSVLLWAYGTSNQRGTLIALWLLLGLTPVAVSYQQRATQVALVPASRLVDNLAAGRLYGSMFSDLEVLRSVVPDSDVVTEIIADLHRRLRQWDYARAIYTELSQDPERATRNTAPAYSNIGVFHHRKGDYETAVNYFKRATDADPTLPEAFFNLSQAYAQLYDFNNQHEAMAKAKELGGDRVDQWNDAGITAEESAVAVDGGLRRVSELRNRIDELWRGKPKGQDLASLWRRFRALLVAFAAIALAFSLSQLRRQMGSLSDRLAPSSVRIEDSRWARALIPGLASMAKGRGISAYIGIAIPVGLILVSAVRGFGYRATLATSPAHWLAIGTAALILALVYAIRCFQELYDT